MNNPFNALAMPHAQNANAFQAGLDQGRQLKAEGETRNALGALAMNPNDEAAMANLAKYNPQAALAMQDRNAKAQQEARGQQLIRAAMGEGPQAEAALVELAAVNRAAWKDISKDQQDKIARESEIFGQAALDFLQVPFDQRRGRFVQFAQQFPDYKDEIQEIAFLPQDQQEMALRGVVIDARMVGKLHQMERPSYQAIPEGGTLVNTKDPGAVRQFQAQPSGGLSVVRTGRDASGRRVVELSDGSIQYAD